MINPTATHAALVAVTTERTRQDSKWGIQDHHPLEWLSILGEEYGEVSKAINEAYWGGKSWDSYREELAHVAAVAVAALECLDRNGWPRTARADEVSA